MSLTRKSRYLFVMTMLLTFLFLGTAKAEAAVAPMPVKVTSGKKTSAKVTWKKVKDASGYEVWLSECNGLIKYEKVATLKKNADSYKIKGLSADKCYKLRVYAMKKGTKIASSRLLHFVTAGNTEYTNIKKVTLNKSSVTLTAGKKKKVKATYKRVNNNKKLLGNGHVSKKIRYFSTNTKIATVSGSGVIAAKKKEGSCRVYAIAANGVWDSVKVTVKKAPKKASTPAKQSDPSKLPTISGSTGTDDTPAPAAPATPEEKKYILSYTLTGSVPKGVQPPSVKLSEGEKITPASVKVPEGYTFEGWEVAGGGTVPTSMPAKDVELIGYFEKESYKLTVKHKYIGANGDVPSAYAGEKTMEYEFGEKIKLETPSAKGYVFAGWEEPVPSKMPAKDVTVTGQWLKSFTLTYYMYDEYSTLIGMKNQELSEGEHALSELYTVKDFSTAYLPYNLFDPYNWDIVLEGNLIDYGGYSYNYSSLFLGWYLSRNSYGQIEFLPLFQELVKFNQQAEKLMVKREVDIVQKAGLENGPVINEEMSLAEVDRILSIWWNEHYGEPEWDALQIAVNEYDDTEINAALEEIEKERYEFIQAYGEMIDENGFSDSITITEDLTLFGFYRPFYMYMPQETEN